MVGLALIAIADQGDVPPIETLHGEIGLVLFIFGLIAPFGFWSVHLAVEQWVDETGAFYAGEYSRPVTVAASVAFGLLALGIFTFALMPLLAFSPDEGEGLIWKLTWLMGGSLCLAVFVSAVAGGVALFGWPGAVVGALTGAGFCVLVWGRVFAEPAFMTPLGLVLLVLGTAGFWALRGRPRVVGRKT